MKKRYLILTLLLVLLPINVKAASISISCNKSTADSNSNVVCKVYAKDSKVSGAEGKVSITNGEIVSQSKNKCEIGSVDKNGFECVDTEVDNSLQVVTYTIKVGNEGVTTFQITNGKVVGNNYDTLSVGTAKTTINIKKVEKTITKTETKKDNNKEVKDEPKKEEKTEQAETYEKKETCKPDSYHKFIEIYAIVITVLFGILAIHTVSRKDKITKIN